MTYVGVSLVFYINTFGATEYHNIKMMRLIRRTIYYSCDNKKYYTNRLYKKICNSCLSVNINNMKRCVYCDKDLNDETIRLVKNDVYTDIINVRRFFKNDEGKKSDNSFEKKKNKESEIEEETDATKDISNGPILLMNDVEIDGNFVYLKNREVNKCTKLYAYYNCYDYIVINNPYSVGCVHLNILFKGILYDMKNLKKKHLSCLLHVYNYINCIIDVFLYYLLIGKGKTVHYKYMYALSNEQKKKIPDYNEEIIEIISRLNHVIKERKRHVRTLQLQHDHKKETKTENDDSCASHTQHQHRHQKQKEHKNQQVSEFNIIHHLNKQYENIYDDIFKKTKDPLLFDFYDKIENINIKKKIALLKKHLYIGCSYPSPINHFSIQVVFPPFSNFNFFTFPFYFPIQRILYQLYLHGHVKNYSYNDIMKNIYSDTLLKQIKESDVIVRELLHF